MKGKELNLDGAAFNVARNQNPRGPKSPDFLGKSVDDQFLISMWEKRTKGGNPCFFMKVTRSVLKPKPVEPDEDEVDSFFNSSPLD